MGAKVRIVCISDTHNKAPGEGYSLPPGDVLVHAGDFTNEGSYEELRRAATWLQRASHQAKVVVAGNHDLSLDPVRKDSNVQTESIQICRELFNSIPGLAYLQHSSAVIELPDKGVSLNVFGSPHSAEQQGGRYSAFQYAADDAVATWDAIPADTDVLITHTPPATVCDQSAHYTEGGCRALLEAVARVRPVLHICGHYHEGWGAETVRWAKRSGGKDISRLSWQDPGAGNKKLSLLDLTGKNGRALEKGMETAVVNASMVVRDLKTGKKTFNKPVIVDIFV